MTRRVSRGDKLRVSASAYNHLLDLAQNAPELIAGVGGGQPEPPELSPVRVRFVNATGAALKPGAVVALDEPHFAPEDEPDRWRIEPLPKGATPAPGDGTAATGARVVGVVVVGCAADEDAVGECVVAGLVVVRVVAGLDVEANAAPKWLSVADDASAAVPTSEVGAAFARVQHSQPATTTGVYAFALMGASAPPAAVRFGIVVDASAIIQPTPNEDYVGTIYAQETAGPTADLVGDEPTLTIRVPHRRRIGDPETLPDLAFAPSRIFHRDGDRIAFLEAGDGTLVLLSDYDEWERVPLYYGKVVDSSGSPAGGNPPHVRDNTGAGLPKQVRLLVLDSATNDPLAAPWVGKKVWAGIGESAAKLLAVGQILGFRSYLGSPLHEHIAIWDNWGEATTGLVVVAGEPTIDLSCLNVECQATVGTRDVSDDHTGELRIRRGKAAPDDATKRRRELRIGLSMRGQAKVVAGKPDLCGLELPGLPPSTLESFGHSSAAATPRLWRHLVVEGAGSPAAPRFDFVELDWTAPGLSGYLYFWHIVVSTSHFPTQLDLLQHWVLFDRGVLVNRGWGPGKWRVTTTYWADAYPGGPEWVGFTPRETALTEPWPNNCCDG